ncbi:uncharacterized protein ARMOST_17819 [Armillaria ostoyae]|uniref:Uncharacterized protein n=1 Tax=Armillaria ostoyae TaxID=47428 RepID=A0A284S025_ARMOS|nr:uncharacterized protein ARMOST_17819 [Armillaria ostoyae]
MALKYQSGNALVSRPVEQCLFGSYCAIQVFCLAPVINKYTTSEPNILLHTWTHSPPSTQNSPSSTSPKYLRQFPSVTGAKTISSQCLLMPMTGFQESEGTASWLKARTPPFGISQQPYNVAYGYKFACTPSTILMQRTFLFINGGVIRVFCGGGVKVVQIFERCEGGKPTLSLTFCYYYIIWLYTSPSIIRIIISSRKRCTFETQGVSLPNDFSTPSCENPSPLLPPYKKP